MEGLLSTGLTLSTFTWLSTKSNNVHQLFLSVLGSGYVSYILTQLKASWSAKYLESPTLPCHQCWQCCSVSAVLSGSAWVVGIVVSSLHGLGSLGRLPVGGAHVALPIVLSKLSQNKLLSTVFLLHSAGVQSSPRHLQRPRHCC